MDDSSYSLMDKLDLQVPIPNIPDQDASLTSMTPVLAADPEAAPSTSSNTLRPDFLSSTTNYKPMDTLYDEHQPLGSVETRAEPLPRKGHTKSRKGCYNCKNRHIKVHLTPIHRTGDLSCIIVSRESSSMHSMC